MDTASEFVRSLTAGASISFQPDVRPSPQEIQQQSVALWQSLGFSAELADLRARSEITRPRREETVRVFDELVREIFVPPLKRAGYRKSRLVWTRTRAAADVRVDLQRGMSSSELLRFTVNWSISGTPARAGRISAFYDDDRDRWWSVQLGRLACDPPFVTEDADVCRTDISAGLERMLVWLDQPPALGRV